MSNYTIITDEKKLKEFIDWLPELKQNEKYYLTLLSRKKYTPKDKQVSNTRDKNALRRFTSDKERMFNKVWQLEAPIGSYTIGNSPVPQESLVVYISVNPRSTWLATKGLMKELVNWVCEVNGDKKDRNPYQEALSQVHKSKSRTCYLDFDLDVSDEQLLMERVREIKTYVNPEAVTWLKTKGGMHVLVDPKKVSRECRSTYFQKISQVEGMDQKQDLLIPMPGTYQGGFTPHFVDY